jgi:tetratricopeptide (TPR) repeat protein
LKPKSPVLKPANLQMTRKARDPQTLQAVCVCVFLALAVLAVFGQTAGFEFLNYDDRQNVSENPAVQQGLSAKAVGWAFTHAQGCNWIPLTTLSHILDCQLFGLRAGGHHLVNVLIHAATAVLLFLALRQMTGSLWRSAFVAAVFAVHPLRAESVAWVSERKDVLSGLFFMLAIGAYVRQARQPSRAGPVVVFLMFALGLMAKSMVATLPFVLLLLDYWPLGRLRNRQDFLRLVREKIPLFALAAGACVAAALVPGLVITGADRLPLLERIGNAAVSYVVYLGQTVFPAGLAIPYPNPPNGQPPGKVCLALVALAAISAGVMMWRKKRPCLLTGWLWYLGMLLPVIGIVPISADAAHADRYTYLPGIGLALAVTWAVADGSASWKHRRLALGGLMIAAVSALTVRGHIQTSYWKDSQSLWTRALACTSGNYTALINQGALLVKQGKLDEGMALFQKSLEIAPANADALNNLANALATKGEDEAAIAQYQKALEIQPDSAEARYNLANVLVKHGRLDEAIAHYRKSVEINPGNEAAQNNLGQALLLKGDLDGGMAALEKAAAINPDPPARWNSLGREFSQKGNWKAAILFYREATKINPRFAEAWAGLGMACLRNGQTKEAVDAWQKTLELNPANLPVENNLAMLLATASDPSLRNGAEAVALATKASQSSGGGNPLILGTLAAAYAEEGNFDLAAATARRALELAAGQKQDTVAATLQKQIKLYEAKTPLRNAPQ